MLLMFFKADVWQKRTIKCKVLYNVILVEELLNT